jgi:hypothetical protein
VVIVGQYPQQPVDSPAVDPPPVINSFTANPSYIQPGQTVVLTWTVSNAASVTLSPSIGSVSSSGSYSVIPGYTTTYTLSATNSDGSVSASTTVTVTPYASTLNTGSGAEMASAGTVANAGKSSILASGFSGDNGPVNLLLLYILLIGLLAVAAVVAIVLFARKPAAAYAGRHAGTRTGYLSCATDTRVATRTPHTTPIATELGAKFIASDGEYIAIPGNVGSLGRNDFRSLVKSDKADLISRRHIQFDCEDGEYYIEDSNSTNGTKLNGSSINGKGRYLLREGDEVELADILTLTFKT